MITPLVLTALSSFFLIFAVRFFFPRWGLLDNPKKYGHKRDAVPYPAGVIIPLLFFTIAFALTPFDSSLFQPLLGFSLASLLLLIVSFIDDRYSLSPFFRLSVQFFAALIIVAFGIGIDEVRIPFWGDGILHLDLFQIDMFGHTFILISDTLAILWILFMVNAMNWLDGVSGLTSSVSSIASAILGMTAYMFGQYDIALLFFVFTTITFIFFLFDIETPKILMGDSGAMFLGLALAVFTIIAGGKVATGLIVMFAPLFDALWTIFRRIKEKKSPFHGDLNHLHHNLLKILPSRRTVVLVYAFCVLLFGLIALCLETQGKIFLFFLLCILMFFLELLLLKKTRK